ncbi:autoinducer binding domain-containing protein [Aliiroseovarius sp. YM-037]|uniref:autoinducer binding domain-containing protein n=1 Tax=Aliiroseovarius sp. YM-037 TaxID=3341728 RepID=UPI003A7F7EE1
MDQQLSISPVLAKLDGLCPAGYAIALHIKFTTPTFLFQTYAQDWMDYYSQNGLVLHDPTVRWGFENTGTRVWKDLEAEDEHSVLKKARKHGLSHGFVAAHVGRGTRSVASFARSDRDFDDAEIAQISEMFVELHDETVDAEQLSAEEREALKQLSITLTHG